MSDAPAEQAAVLKLTGITKRFGALLANHAINLELYPGEIVALLGENGAGKTTLMNILFGHYVADEGTVQIATADGGLRPLAQGSPQAALKAGIGMVHQHFTLAENLTGIDNILLGTRSLLSPIASKRSARTRLDKIMRESGLTVDLDTRVSRLSVGEQQRIEILKALYRDARVLVLDEPTAVLTPQESENLFQTLRSLADEGLSIVFISHKMAEVLSASDRIAVLRHGELVADLPSELCDRNMLADIMVGRHLEPEARSEVEKGPALLKLSGISTGHGRDALHNVSLQVHGGEIVGLAGVSGNGQGALARIISGLELPRSGSMEIDGRRLKPAPRAVMREGLVRIPEDRHRDGIVGEMTVAENLVIEDVRSRAFQSFGFLDFAAIDKRAGDAIDAYDIRCPGGDAVARLLSGGNIQKIILARTLDKEPKVVLAAQPTRGLDIGATEDVHRRLFEARARGAAILLISEDLDELFQMSDRIAVIHRGKVTLPQETATLNRSQVGLMMAGQESEDAA
ncbi:ATP-binding cassette domain-containing protein [Stappia sp. GBMRC 2046]|uniref:ATP-binding cassette domain-containing protein n=1 Tax=Stappia sediminis TaxID=2692190 RepID=A0A7X3LUS1_9HYPH|nr:ABC transporter ATP-binding protein [Stappia sediminis]MXN65487.1 ATP-binding cassette domain-containing protein [Stappia sediminis]